MLIEGIQVPPDVLVIHPPGPIVGEHCVPDGFPGSLVVVQGKFTSPDRVWANCDGFDDICSELSMTPSHEAVSDPPTARIDARMHLTRNPDWIAAKSMEPSRKSMERFSFTGQLYDKSSGRV